MKQIEGYKNKYGVSEDGKIFSLDYRGTGMTQELSPGTDRHGYNRVCLCKNGKQKVFLVHRLVAQAFLQDYDPDLDVDHIDRNPSNNHVSNLRMTTRSQNNQNNNAKGVYFRKDRKKWFAKLQINNKQYNGPHRTTKEEALADREELIKKYGTLLT